MTSDGQPSKPFSRWFVIKLFGVCLAGWQLFFGVNWTQKRENRHIWSTNGAALCSLLHTHTLTKTFSLKSHSIYIFQCNAFVLFALLCFVFSVSCLLFIWNFIFRIWENKNGIEIWCLFYYQNSFRKCWSVIRIKHAYLFAHFYWKYWNMVRWLYLLFPFNFVGMSTIHDHTMTTVVRCELPISLQNTVFNFFFSSITNSPYVYLYKQFPFIFVIHNVLALRFSLPFHVFAVFSLQFFTFFISSTKIVTDNNFKHQKLLA